MTKRMLVDATHSEETRVAVVDGNRLVDFDYESFYRKQLKGSIFLAKVTRVEPSLQAAFVNFGGNRHGFLPFAEIHPDYYRIPIADREALIAEQEREMEERLAAEEAEDYEDEDDEVAEDIAEDDEDEDDEIEEIEEIVSADAVLDEEVNGNVIPEDEIEDDNIGNRADGEDDGKNQNRGGRGGRNRGGRGRGGRNNNSRGRGGKGGGKGRRMAASSRRVETVGGDGIEGDQPIRPSLRKNYKIQEVVKRGQIMLIQVSKEERGNKGAAVSTYLSLPGRYCVLMPNSPRAGGVSRKIANYKERKRMRDLLNELKVPQGMSVIMRTAGTSRTKAEIKRDLDYLLRLWDNIRELTLESSAPALIHEEGNLIRRSIRDIYSSDIEEVLVSGEKGHKFAKDFMKMMIPSHAKRVQEYKDDQIPLFHRYQVESQINEIGDPVVTLPSGGYLVINPTEALVSVDVNSGRATKERHIEETALRTNVEAAQEVARQLKLRDLGGLVVIDFIDMEDRRNNRKVENKLKDALSNDRARIQIGRISTFGLLELSRQRLNPSLTEAQYEKCSHCQGVGNVRTVDATAIVALRALEEEGIRDRAKDIVLHVCADVALYILNNKRPMLTDIENRYGFSVMIKVNDEFGQSQYLVEPLKTQGGQNDDEDEPQEAKQNNNNNNTNKGDDDQQERSSRRRRGRRGGRRRGRNRDNAEDGNEGQPEEAKADSNKGKKDDADKEAKAADTVEDKKEEKAASKKTAKKSRKSSKKSAAKKDTEKTDKADEKADKKESGKKDDDGEKKKKPSRAKKKEPESAKEDKSAVKDVAPSNDTTPPPVKDYETVNEAPKSKKKGWWSKGSD